MPYIDYIETAGNYNYYKPSDSLRNLFENKIITPLSISLPSVASNPKIMHDLSGTVLGQGRANFDESYQDYTPENKVLLYCAYYMSMHLYSSYHFYTRHIPLIDVNNVVFIDFGCGPLTSGIAFWAAAAESNVTYIGIDSSQSMLAKAREINRYGHHPNFEVPFYPDGRFYLIDDYNSRLPGMLDNILRRNSGDALIIFNFCYFLQSKSIDHSNLDSLAKVVTDVVDKYGNYKIFIAYQDPVGATFKQKWYNFKSRLTIHPSISNNFTWQDEASTMHIKYDRVMLGGLHPPKVSYDMLYNGGGVRISDDDIPF